jgi:hypothetical protein
VTLRRVAAPEPLQAEPEQPVRAGVPRILVEDPREQVGGRLETGELEEGARLLGADVEVVREGPRGQRDPLERRARVAQREERLPLDKRQARPQLLVVAASGEPGALDGEVERTLRVSPVERVERPVEQGLGSEVRGAGQGNPQRATGFSAAAM